MNGLTNIRIIAKQSRLNWAVIYTDFDNISVWRWHALRQVQRGAGPTNSVSIGYGLPSIPLASTPKDSHALEQPFSFAFRVELLQFLRRDWFPVGLICLAPTILFPSNSTAVGIIRGWGNEGEEEEEEQKEQEQEDDKEEDEGEEVEKGGDERRRRRRSRQKNCRRKNKSKLKRIKRRKSRRVIRGRQRRWRGWTREKKGEGAEKGIAGSDKWGEGEEDEDKRELERWRRGW